MPVFQLNDSLVFPNPELADPTGLLAVGGDLRVERLVLAYSNGIFPWPHRGMPLLWFSPDPRMVLTAEELHIARRLRRTIRSGRYEVRLDSACSRVIRACAEIQRSGENGTWITKDMQRAYLELHRRGLVHSAETWVDGELVGGLYGVSLGAAFIGESMFAKARDCSKIAFVTLVRQLQRWGFELIDVQVYTDHLARFGAVEWDRADYLDALSEALRGPTRRGKWVLDDDLARGADR